MWIYEVLSKIIEMSFIATVVILAVLLIRVLFRRLPKVFQYVLWSVVLFRLLCPVSISTPVSMFQVFGITEERVQTIEIHGNEQENLQEKTAGYVESVNMELENPDGTKNTIKILNEKRAEAELEQFGELCIVAVWILGIVFVLGYSIVSLVRLNKNLVGALQLKDNIYLCDYIKTPFVMGVVKPKIYLPSFLGEEEKEYIILHEQVHIRRGDHIFRLLAFFALALHWFNPFVWLAYFLSGVDMEMSCDEAVMKKSDNDIRAEYSTSLLSLATGKRFLNGALLAFGEGNVKNRIKNVMKFKKPAVLTVVAAVFVVVVLICAMGSNPKAVTEDIPVENQILEEKQKELQKMQGKLEEVKEDIEVLEQELQEEALSLEDVTAQIDSWARAFCNRDVSTIISMTTTEAQENLEQEELLMGENSFGWSSPWPWGEDTDYRILEVTDSSATVLYYAWVSDPHVWVWRETLLFHEEDGRIIIDAEELKEMYDICSAEEYFNAYPNGIAGTPMDYLNEPMITDDSYETTGEILDRNAHLSSSNIYLPLFAPDTAAVYLLNLLDNPNKVKVDVRMHPTDGSASVQITFLEFEEAIIVNMVQPYGEGGIWLVQE